MKVYENATAYTSLFGSNNGKLDATDVDISEIGQTIYYVAKNTSSVPFTVDRSTGLVYVLSATLNYLTTKTYSFPVAVYDSAGAYATTVLTVGILEVNKVRDCFHHTPKHYQVIGDGRCCSSNIDPLQSTFVHHSMTLAAESLLS